MRSLYKFVRQYPTKSFSRGETILLQHETPPYLFSIKNGFVKGYDIDGQGTEQLVWLGGPSDLFLVDWAFAEEPSAPYFFSAFCDDVTLHMVDLQEFRAFLDKSHTGLMEITTKLIGHLGDTFRHLNATEKAKAGEKLAYALHYLAERFGTLHKQGGHTLTLPLTHQDIANLLGLTRETVTVELKKLKDDGYIHYDKVAFIIYLDKIESIL